MLVDEGVHAFAERIHCQLLEAVVLVTFHAAQVEQSDAVLASGAEEEVVHTLQQPVEHACVDVLRERVTSNEAFVHLHTRNHSHRTSSAFSIDNVGVVSLASSVMSASPNRSILASALRSNCNKYATQRNSASLAMRVT